MLPGTPLARPDLVDADARLVLLEADARLPPIEGAALLPLEGGATSLLGVLFASRIFSRSWRMAVSALRARWQHDHTHLVENLLHTLCRLRARLDIQAVHLPGVRGTFVLGDLRKEEISTSS